MSIEECANCRFHRDGECHKAPPVRLPRKFDAVATAGNRVREEALIWGWPGVGENDWCGGWFPKARDISA
jgi:phenylpropionate dioxygenase-like ring-hydroxylating dioxygenase large terminal subunit